MMKSSPPVPGTLYLVFVGVLLTTCPLQDAWTEGQDMTPVGPMLDSRVLKRRVQVVAVPPRDTQKAKETNKIILKTEGWQALLIQEGLAISQEDWVSAMDLLKVEIGKSSVLRLVSTDLVSVIRGDAPLVGSSGPTPRSLFLLTRFGVGAAGSRVLIYLVDASTGTSIATVDQRSKSIEDAIRKGLSSLEKRIALMAWRCHVVGETKVEFIIARGRLDGLRKGQRFIGYSIVNGKEHVDIATELVMMKFGTRKGLYEVSEAGEQFSKVRPVGGAPLLQLGDLLELPPVRIPDREKSTRGRRVWDEIYKDD